MVTLQFEFTFAGKELVIKSKLIKSENANDSEIQVARLLQKVTAENFIKSGMKVGEVVVVRGQSNEVQN